MRRTLHPILHSICAVAVVLAGVCATRVALAAETTRVISGIREPGTMFDLSLSLAWTHEGKTASIQRERGSQATGGQIKLDHELIYRQTRDTLRLRADAGVYKDLSVFLELPLVLADDRSLDFDRAGTCGVATSGCASESTATILRDRILPGFGLPSYGIDSAHGRPFARPSETVFRGPTRKGLEYLGLGMSWALLNQARQAHQPTWIVRFQSRLAVGADQRFDPLRPGSNTGVSPGYHQLVFSTAFSRRFSSLEPHLGGWYMLPLTTSGSPVARDVLGKSAATEPQKRAGAHFGVEATVWDDPRSQRRITLELSGRLELRSFGLAQGELWEPLSGAAACGQGQMAQMACRRDVDRDLNGDTTPEPNPGTTRMPAYGTLGGEAGISVRAGRFLFFRGMFGLSFEEAHLLSDGQSGNEVYDIPGRRFRLEDGRTWHVLIDGAIRF